MTKGVFIRCDGNQDGVPSWNVYVLDESGSVDLLSPEWNREVKQEKQVLMPELDKDTKKVRKALRTIPVKIGMKRVTGESQVAAMARAVKELQAMVRMELLRMSKKAS